MALCGWCQRFFEELFTEENRQGLGDGKGLSLLFCPLGHLFESSRTCSFCSVIVDSLVLQSIKLIHPPKEDLEDMTYAVSIGTQDFEPHIRRAVNTGGKASLDGLFVYYGANKSRLSVFASEGSSAALSGDINTFSQLPSSDSPEAFSFLRRMVQQCVQNHPECRETLSGDLIDDGAGSLLPSRVIDVGSYGSSMVCLEQGLDKYARYTALSHCWGPPETRPLVTTRANFREHLVGIRFDKLPKTFQDAIIVTRELDIQYIWIDSICIIQDDEEDWLTSSRVMGDIYSQSFVTIAASGAVDSSQGCFLPRPLPWKTCEVPYYPGSGEKQQGFFNISIPQPRETAQTSKAPLSRRGWVTQEWLLTRRLVHFLEGGINWRCKHWNRLEVTETGELSGNNELLSWMDTISSYSSRGLTKASDRLVAIHGYANEVQKSRVDHYHHGLWESELPEALLWIPAWQAPSRLPELTQIPTWSWGGLHTAVSWRNLPSKKPPTLEEYVKLTSCFNSAMAKRFWEALYETEEVKSDRTLTQDIVIDDDGKLQITAPLLPWTDINSVSTLSFDTGEAESLFGVDDDPDNSYANKDLLQVLVLGRFNSNNFDALLLGKTSDDAVYTRVGVCEICSENWENGANVTRVTIV